MSESLALPVDEIGSRVRSHRRSRGWSMRELARRAGVSQPFVSKLEGGQLLPSLPTLYALAAVFEVPASSLLPSVGGDAGHPVDPSPDPSGPTGPTGPISDPSSTVVHLPLSDEPGATPVRLIAGGEGNTIQAYEFRLGPHDGDVTFFQHSGEEFVYVIDGLLVSQRAGTPDLALPRGASLRIDPTIEHRWATTDAPATFLLVCTESIPGVRSD